MTEKYIGIPKLMDLAKYGYGIALFFRRMFRKPSSFVFDGQNLIYFEHPYNGTWMNERSVEIPVIWEQVKSLSPDKVLEVGNVLSHYFEVKHLVVDKYERRPGVISDDILDVKLDEKFDRIVSISTLEHIGWDEVPRSPGKYIQAIERLRTLLTDEGILIATIPLGYNPSFDQDLFEQRLKCDRVSYLKRLTIYSWGEASQEDIRGAQYGKKYRTTEGLAVCIWRRN